MSTLNLENIKHPDSASNNISVDSSGNTNVEGNIGVGGVDPSTLPVFIEHAIEVSNGAGVGIHSANSGDNRWIFFGHGTANLDVQQAGIVNQGSDQSLALATGGTQRMRIDSAGRVTMPYQPMCFVTRISEQAVSNDANSPTDLVLNSPVYNVGNHFNDSNSRWTAPVTGYYEFSWSYGTNFPEGSSVYRTFLWKNGSRMNQLSVGLHCLRT